jgi:hypothetical protein
MASFVLSTIIAAYFAKPWYALPQKPVIGGASGMKLSYATHELSLLSGDIAIPRSNLQRERPYLQTD